MGPLNLWERLGLFLAAVGIGMLAVVYILNRDFRAEYFSISSDDIIGGLERHATIRHGITPSVKVRASEVVQELREESDDDLTAMRSAKRPCANFWVACRGLSDDYVHTLASEENVRRTAAKEADLKERAQKSQDETVRVAFRNAESSYIAAIAARDTAHIARSTLLWTAVTAIVGALTLIIGGVSVFLTGAKYGAK